MKSQFRFYMHPKDEREFLAFVLTEPGVALVYGANWPGPEPVLVGSVADVTDFAPLLIWSPKETRPLKAELIQSSQGPYWSCENDDLGIQMLRSHIFRRTVLTEGRIAIGTNRLRKKEEEGLVQRYRKLQKWLKGRFVNSVLSWRDGEPDSQTWVGPHALVWVVRKSGRCIRAFENGPQATILPDRVPAEAAAPARRSKRST